MGPKQLSKKWYKRIKVDFEVKTYKSTYHFISRYLALHKPSHSLIANYQQLNQNNISKPLTAQKKRPNAFSLPQTIKCVFHTNHQFHKRKRIIKTTHKQWKTRNGFK